MSFPCHGLHHEAGSGVEPRSRMVSSTLIKMGPFRFSLRGVGISISQQESLYKTESSRPAGAHVIGRP